MPLDKPSTWFHHPQADAPLPPAHLYPRRAHAVDAITGARAARAPRCPLTQPTPASTWMTEQTPIHDTVQARLDPLQLLKAV